MAWTPNVTDDFKLMRGVLDNACFMERDALRGSECAARGDFSTHVVSVRN